ncbi:52 kDa repressor of the inhibitor of the protein kinase-like [Macrobrachium rosenbergii]|uniref:52 kDa repressor of the inhibitor of the protein kinase-like n=1 Tax=Macrobrachium rosenbergii TaxID=79674 RepID=UPI0034D7375F
MDHLHYYTGHTKKTSGSKGRVCSAINCTKYTKTNKEVAFYSFPKDNTRCAEWIRNLRREDLLGKSPDQMKWRRVCSDHFATSQFKNPNDRKSGLLPNSILWLIDCPNPPKSGDVRRKQPRDRGWSAAVEDHDSSSMNETAQAEAGVNTAVWFKEESAATENKLSTLQKKEVPKTAMTQVYAIIRQCLPPLAAKFVIEQLQVSGRHKNGIQWSDCAKSAALQLKNASPKAYRILSKVFTLPSKSTLVDLFNMISIEEGWHDSVLYMLQHKWLFKKMCLTMCHQIQ